MKEKRPESGDRERVEGERDLVEELPRDGDDARCLSGNRIKSSVRQIKRVRVALKMDVKQTMPHDNQNTNLAARAGVGNGGCDLFAVGRVGNENLLATQRWVHALLLNSDDQGGIGVDVAARTSGTTLVLFYYY
jgi:hypothetical protein